ncbi:unnamed protein product [Urochloa humidicola]
MAAWRAAWSTRSHDRLRLLLETARVRYKAMAGGGGMAAVIFFCSCTTMDKHYLTVFPFRVCLEIMLIVPFLNLQIKPKAGFRILN